MTPIPPPARKRWNRQECLTLEAAGLFKKERLELVDGELISKRGKNRPHVNAFTLMHLWLLEAFGKLFVNAEAPIDVSAYDNQNNEPEPDLIVLKRECTSFVSGNPQAKDLNLLVEISDSSLSFDLSFFLTTKASLYARAGVVEYWVLDVEGRRLIVHRDPISGRFSNVSVYEENELVAPLAAPMSLFRPSQAFLSS